MATIAAPYPEGAPWGAANPDAGEHCASCHYDFDPVSGSDALTIAGLPATVAPGTEYPLEIHFRADAVVAGFQLVASTGTLLADADDIEALGPAARSTATRAAGQRFSWSLRWYAPADLSAPLFMYLAASAANDDQSPFGDIIHYRRFELSVDARTGVSE